MVGFLCPDFFTFSLSPSRYDRRFMLKMETEKSISIFLSFLEDYIGHFIGSPHSLLVKILGVYSVRVARARRQRKRAAYFIVMQSVFWPSSRCTSMTH